MDRLSRTVERASTVAAWIGGGMLMLSAVLVSVEVVLRKLFVISVGGANEISGYVLAISSSWAFAFTLLHRGHIRIDALYRTLPIRLRASLDVLALLSLLGFTGILTWYASGVLAASLRFGATSNTPIETPLWLPQSLWLLGLVMFLAVLLFVLWRTVAALARGDHGAVQRLAGTPGAEEEVEEELRGLAPDGAAGPRR